MPDWTYQTLFRRLLFAMGPESGRDLALGSLGTLARLPLGRHLIQLMGHMRPDSRLAFERGSLSLQSRIGVGCHFDSRLAAPHALAEFGVGYLEIGPVSSKPSQKPGPITLEEDSERILISTPQRTITPDEVRRRLERGGPLRIPCFARIEPDSEAECEELVHKLSPLVAGFVIPVERLHYDVVKQLSEALEKGSSPIRFVALSPASWSNSAFRDQALSALNNQRITGFIVESSLDSSGNLLLAHSELRPVLEFLSEVREAVGPDPILIVSAGIHSPADALDALASGADLLQIDSGFVFAGPGLPKRINEALLYLHEQTHPAPAQQRVRLGGEAWFWAFLMGLAMLIGGILALVIASTRVVLPYDEAISGFSRETLILINPRLLDFMTHDRVTLAGTMLADAILYLAFAWFGLRRGSHWAYVTVICSAFPGFICFFSFLGFGYFDPFHAFVTAIMFQFLTLTMHSHLAERHEIEMPDLYNDARWHRRQWGQLISVIHGAILIVAGLVISWVATTSVFVQEDLEFMQTSVESLCGPNPTLLPLIAHDRATFGGMLISCGAAVLLSGLWGFGRNRAWLWWSLVLAGNFAYLLTIFIHFSVGYTSLKHLLPAYAGVFWLWLGGIASYDSMVSSDPQLKADWSRRIEFFSTKTGSLRDLSRHQSSGTRFQTCQDPMTSS